MLPAHADPIRIATFHTNLSERGPGLLLRKLLEGTDPQLAAVIAMIGEADPDILVLQDIDFDAGGAALGELALAISQKGPTYAHRFALRPNSGLATGLDMDGDGRLGGPRDAQGYGWFSGDGGMAILSRYPVITTDVIDLSATLWRDLPGAIPPELPDEVIAVQRLSSVAHWIVPIDIDGTPLRLLAWHGTVPVFDGPEDRNGRRNRDETSLWLRLLDGALDTPPPKPPFVIIGIGNVDPNDGEGRTDAIDALLSDPRLSDPLPASEGARVAANPDQSGPPALDTTAYTGRVGNLRLSYVLPSQDLKVVGAGVVWPAPDTPEARRLGDPDAWPAHRLVWVDIALD